jgi:hypothetical protein
VRLKLTGHPAGRLQGQRHRLQGVREAGLFTARPVGFEPAE